MSGIMSKMKMCLNLAIANNKQLLENQRFSIMDYIINSKNKAVMQDEPRNSLWTLLLAICLHA